MADDFDPRDDGLARSSSREEVAEIKRVVKSLIDKGSSIASLADEAGVNINTLKQFIYKDSARPRITETFLKLKRYVHHIDPDPHFNKINYDIFGERLDDAFARKLIGVYFLFRRSFHDERIVKTRLDIHFDESLDVGFNEDIVGLQTKRSIRGKIRKYGSNIYLKGNIYSNHNDDNDEEAEIIGEETIVFLASYAKNDFIVANYLSVSGDFRSICGNSLIFREADLESKIGIGNHREDDCVDLFQGKTVVSKIRHLRDSGMPLRTIAN